METEPVERVRDLEAGEQVLWDDRSVPLTVQDEEVTVTGAADVRAREVANEEQDDGATYILVEQMVASLDPKVRRRVTTSAKNPSGLSAEGYAGDLRRVVSD